VHLASAHFKTFDAAIAEMVTGKTVRILDEVFRP
jgi:quinol monooxygenase YgiN